MTFQRKLLLLVFITLLVVLLWPKGEEQVPVPEEPEILTEEAAEETSTARDSQRSETEQGAQGATEAEVLEELAATPLSETQPDAAAKKRPASPVSGLTQADQDYLYERGIDDPREVLKDLLARDELLPSSSVSDQSLRFVAEETQLLSRRWVLATFTDGSTQGQALYEFEISPGGELIWVLLSQTSR